MTLTWNNCVILDKDILQNRRLSWFIYLIDFVFLKYTLENGITR